MADILLALEIEVSASDVFDALSDPVQISKWFTKDGSGSPEIGTIYNQEFEDRIVWRAMVTKSIPNQQLELRYVQAAPDWIGTTIHYDITRTSEAASTLNFTHSGWKESSDHFRKSGYFWSLYLSRLKDFLEKGIVLPYEDRT